jgi:hypothetical protein
MEGQEQHDAEIRLMGLILAQSTLVGVGIGIFDSEVWLMNDTPWLNGFTYAMGAFFVQGIAYYVFKMFFEQNLQEKTHHSNLERQRTQQYKTMQQQFDNRRSDMEMRMQEVQLERELKWMEMNPGKMPPSWGVPGGAPSLISSYEFDTSRIPAHEANVQQPLTLGANEDDDTPKKKDGTPDKRHKPDN